MPDLYGLTNSALSGVVGFFSSTVADGKEPQLVRVAIASREDAPRMFLGVNLRKFIMFGVC